MSCLVFNLAEVLNISLLMRKWAMCQKTITILYSIFKVFKLLIETFLLLTYNKQKFEETLLFLRTRLSESLQHHLCHVGLRETQSVQCTVHAVLTDPPGAAAAAGPTVGAGMCAGRVLCCVLHHPPPRQPPDPHPRLGCPSVQVRPLFCARRGCHIRSGLILTSFLS